jgi:ribosomal protein L17
MASKRNKRRKTERLSLIKQVVEAILPSKPRIKTTKAERKAAKKAAEEAKALQQGEDWLNYIDWLLGQRKAVRFR